MKWVKARLKNDLSQKKTLLPKGIGRYSGKTATVQDGSGLPYICHIVFGILDVTDDPYVHSSVFPTEKFFSSSLKVLNT